MNDNIAELQRQSYGYVVFRGTGTSEPKYKGCQWLSQSGVFLNTQAVRHFLCGEIYRRPIDPGEGFELVGLDDLAGYAPDQEFTLDGESWHDFSKIEISDSCYTARQILQTFEGQIIIAIRRKKVCAVCGGRKLVDKLGLLGGTKPCPVCQPKTLEADGPAEVRPTRKDEQLKSTPTVAQPLKDSGPVGSLEQRKAIAKSCMNLALYLIARQRLLLVPHCEGFDFIEMTPDECKKWDDADSATAAYPGTMNHKL